MHNGKLNKYYFINNFDTNLINKQDSFTSIIYRNYNEKENKREIILKIRNICKKKNIKFYLANDVKLAVSLKLDGAYIPSFNDSYSHLSYSFFKNFNIIGSAHNIKEMRIKEAQKIKILFISSIFKKNKNYLGLNKFNLLSKFSKNKVVALGGISKKNIKQLKLTSCFGFAGITYFK